MTQKTERRIALFLDFENLVSNTGFSAGSFDLQPSMDRLLEKGKIVFRRAYCDWTRFKDAKAGLHALGVELIDVPPSTAAGKNAADMRLVIDALELCYAREHIDTFVIASGDSDFCPLAYKLRENGRVVIGLAAKESTSPLFVKACDEFIYLKAPSRRGGEEERHRKAQKPAKGDGRERKEGEKPKRGEVPDAVREVVQSLLARSDGPLNPSIIKETLVRKEPDFDTRDLGFSTFSRLLQALEREGMLKLQLKGRQWYVVPPELGLGRETRPTDVEEDEESYPDPDEDD
ncbi:MAG: NYN domain-containing protein [Myxococcaceae bacterium]|nr:NYN domain-containing protein [Myxococcaceae bacterium]MCI0669600.1 NYN domain-containing protein [Myxococcaceae bacterium]